jgi:hypothetical protein
MQSKYNSAFLSILDDQKKEMGGAYQTKINMEMGGSLPKKQGELTVPAANLWGQRVMVDKDRQNLYALGKMGDARDLYFDKNSH